MNINRYPWIALTLACVAVSTAQAQSRWVFVNGQRMSDAQVQELARAQCNEIPDGNYWLNPRNGAWGYVGNLTVQGILGDGCRGGGAGGGVNQDGTRGPFATMRRAEEVANQFRSQGLRAVAFHNGDGYYVRVSR
jgi:hypothetical protein